MNDKTQKKREFDFKQKNEKMKKKFVDESCCKLIY